MRTSRVMSDERAPTPPLAAAAAAADAAEVAGVAGVVSAAATAEAAAAAAAAAAAPAAQGAGAEAPPTKVARVVGAQDVAGGAASAVGDATAAAKHKAAGGDGGAGDGEAGEQQAGGEGSGQGEKKAPKRKVVVFLCYVGLGYAGMQRNPGQRTIESELEDALHKAGLISKQNYGDPSRVHWSRASRTDKGVSAVGQVVSLKMQMAYGEDEAGLEATKEAINKFLPPQVRAPLGARGAGPRSACASSERERCPAAPLTADVLLAPLAHPLRCA